MRIARLAGAILVPGVLGLVALSSAVGTAVGSSDAPERGLAVPLARGPALARAAERAAARGDGPARVGALAVAAIAISPLNSGALFAAARVAGRPDLTLALLEQQRLMSWRHPVALARLADRYEAGGDRQAEIAVLDQLFRTSPAPQPRYTAVLAQLGDPGVRAAVADIFAQPRSWRGHFLGQVAPRADQVAPLALLLDELRRRDATPPAAEIAPILQRLATGTVAQRVAGWTLWRRWAGGDPFRWPDPATPAGIPYEWAVPGDLDGTVAIDAGGLHAVRDRDGATVVASRTTAFAPGRYRVGVDSSDPEAKVQISCNNRVLSLPNSAVATLPGDCPTQDFALLISGKDTKVSAITVARD